MAIKRTINSVAPKTTQLKAPNLKKAVVGVKKNEETIKPQEEIIEEVESVRVENPTPFIPEIDTQNPNWDIPVSFPEDRFEISEREKEAKLAKERKFAKIALCLGIVVLVILIFNKK